MILLALVLFGLCMGSFVNALVWRTYKRLNTKSKKSKAKYSIAKGRSMCSSCGHPLAAKDLVPVLSWLQLKGKCRYCSKPIQDTPVAELVVPALFVFSYIFWPTAFVGKGIVLFIFWLVLLVGFTALFLYDLRWYMLPDRIVYPLIAIVVLQLGVELTVYGAGSQRFIHAFLGVVCGAGLFWAIFQLSKGKWIGGGDVKLAVVFGILVGGPAGSLLVLFIASLLGTILSAPLIATGRAGRTTRLPFGPLLIIGTIIVQLFGALLVTWYKRQVGIV